MLCFLVLSCPGSNRASSKNNRMRQCGIIPRSTMLIVRKKLKINLCMKTGRIKGTSPNRAKAVCGRGSASPHWSSWSGEDHLDAGHGLGLGSQPDHLWWPGVDGGRHWRALSKSHGTECKPVGKLLQSLYKTVNLVSRQEPSVSSIACQGISLVVLLQQTSTCKSPCGWVDITIDINMILCKEG